MYLALTIFAALLGLLVTAAAVFTAWIIWRQSKILKGNRKENLIKITTTYLLKWTLLDYTILVLFLTGMLFLFTDLLAVMRDHKYYPSYHYGYLLCGFVFSFLGMLFMFIRLGIILRIFRSNDVISTEHHKQPTQTNDAE